MSLSMAASQMSEIATLSKHGILFQTISQKSAKSLRW